MSSLLSSLTSYAQSNTVPLHMPGHKRDPSLPGALPYAVDITEIDGFDNLHEPTGILAAAQDRAAWLYGSDHTYFLVNGSTGGILAGIYACTKPGDKVLLARNCHQSVYHGIEIGGLWPVYLEPTLLPHGLLGGVTAEAVRAGLEENPGVSLVILTSPTYEGMISPVVNIAAICHAHGTPLIVDEAHGAHLGFGNFPKGSLLHRADIVVHSLHKTLPALTQTGLLHIQGDLIGPDQIRHALAVFQTSSPSYPLMASIDHCLGLMEDPALFDDWYKRLINFKERARELQNIRFFPADDPSKLPLFCGDGYKLMERLRLDYNIKLEMAADNYILAMTGPYTTDEHLDRFYNALSELDKITEHASTTVNCQLSTRNSQLLSPGDAVKRPSEPTSNPVGRIAAEYIWAYPPGVPLLAPGQEISAEVMELIARSEHLHSTYRRLPKIMVVI